MNWLALHNFVLTDIHVGLISQCRCKPTPGPVIHPNVGLIVYRDIRLTL